IHSHGEDGKIKATFPASGLVSALEPVMRACSGTWVAHGSGNADRETVDSHDRVRVPPDKPSYQIRRVWLSPEEEQGYYYGFSNEGLWPLCHVAHTRPVFRSSDWEMYVKVNRKFADAVIQEARTDNPVILVQDYHFALLPRMIKEKLPNASVITFWHIPWPNPEAFGICPWREEILHGLLGSSILGFHTRFHCNNFLETVDRFMETRIDRETSTITSGGSATAVRQYPISIEWPSRWLDGQPSIEECNRIVRDKLKVPAGLKLGIGVDRLDYTKGILERFRAVERLLELEPQWREKFSFVQIASPSRSTIDSYKNFDQAVREEAERINKLYGSEGYTPIILLVEHHGPKDVFRYFRACDICFVSSLHDGMNLVAKEYVAAREDEQGTLILSQFTGAARELPEALIVNPYDTDQCAAALQMALEMSAREQRDRMRSMRNFVKEFNVYRWAGRMLVDAARMRQKSRFREKKFFGGQT
ncbi:MAG: trehalose-6-phosphate synthase, partial [Proteobacteria bacterium]